MRDVICVKGLVPRKEIAEEILKTLVNLHSCQLGEISAKTVLTEDNPDLRFEWCIAVYTYPEDLDTVTKLYKDYNINAPLVINMSQICPKE